MFLVFSHTLTVFLSKNKMNHFQLPSNKLQQTSFLLLTTNVFAVLCKLPQAGSPQSGCRRIYESQHVNKCIQCKTHGNLLEPIRHEKDDLCTPHIVHGMNCRQIQKVVNCKFFFSAHVCERKPGETNRKWNLFPALSHCDLRQILILV